VCAIVIADGIVMTAPKVMAEQQQPPQSQSHRWFGGDLITNFAPANWLFRHRLSDAKDDLARESVLESIKY
jgi:hypothetical protein